MMMSMAEYDAFSAVNAKLEKRKAKLDLEIVRVKGIEIRLECRCLQNYFLI